MTYQETRGATVTRKQAAQEYKRHGLTVADLVDDLGDRPSYSARAILTALGY